MWSSRSGLLICALFLLPAAGFMAGRLSRGPASGSSGLSAQAEGHGDRLNADSGQDGGRRTSRDSAPAKRKLFEPGKAQQWLVEYGRSALRDDPLAALRMNESLEGADNATLLELARAALAGDGHGGEAPRGTLLVALHLLSRRDPELAISVLRESGNAGLNQEWQAVFANYALFDPAAAQAALAAVDKGNLPHALEGVMSVLNGSDPETALALISGYPDPDFSNERRKLVEKIAAQDIGRALAMAEEMMKNGGDFSVIGSVISIWQDRDPDAALAWAARYDGPGKDEVKGRAIASLIKQDPRKAMALWNSLEGMEDGSMAKFAGALSSRLAQQDAAAARGWVDGLAAGPAKNAAAAALVDRWARSDVSAASTYLRTLPEGDARNQAAAQFASAINRQHPAEAFAWTVTLPEGQVRERVMAEVMNGWRQDDPAAAEKAWAEYTARGGK